MKWSSWIAIGLVALMGSNLCANSLLKNDKFGSPSKHYTKALRKFKKHDTVMVNVNIDDTIRFSKKQDTKSDVTWLNAFKSYITHFGGVNAKQLPNVEIEGSSQRKSNGTKTGTNRIRLEVPCEVIEVLANGDLVLGGARTINADDSNATVRVGGRVSPMYVSQQTHSVLSERILELNVKTDFKGPLRDSEKRGFITRLLDKFKIF